MVKVFLIGINLLEFREKHSRQQLGIKQLIIIIATKKMLN